MLSFLPLQHWKIKTNRIKTNYGVVLHMVKNLNPHQRNLNNLAKQWHLCTRWITDGKLSLTRLIGATEQEGSLIRYNCKLQGIESTQKVLFCHQNSNNFGVEYYAFVIRVFLHTKNIELNHLLLLNLSLHIV